MRDKVGEDAIVMRQGSKAMVLVMRDKVGMGRNVQVFYRGHKAPKKRTEMRKKKVN